MIQMNLQNRKKLTDLEQELMVARGRMWGRDSEGVWDGPWRARRSNQSILKEIHPEYSLEGLMLKLKLQ